MALDAADVAMFLDEDMPGRVVTVAWKPEAGPGASFPARFKRVSSAILGGMVSGEEPQILFATDDAEEMAGGDVVTIDEVDYTVRDVLPFLDGEMTRAMLRPVS